jgi:ABC-type antimicrobial peptide transport system permease subunit
VVQVDVNDDTRRSGFPRITAERRQRFLASTIAVTPAGQGHSSLRRQLSQSLWVLFAATAVLLSLACLNVAGVKVRGTPEQAAESIRSIVHNADSALPITYFRTVNEQVSRSLNTERILATLSSGFGALALLLSLVGLYGVMSFVVTQRTREIGIRIALGARGSSAVWLVLRDAIVMVVAGIAVALPCVGVLGRLVESQLFGITATDPATIAGTTVLLAVAALGLRSFPRTAPPR